MVSRRLRFSGLRTPPRSAHHPPRPRLTGGFLLQSNWGRLPIRAGSVQTKLKPKESANGQSFARASKQKHTLQSAICRILQRAEGDGIASLLARRGNVPLRSIPMPFGINMPHRAGFRQRKKRPAIYRRHNLIAFIPRIFRFACAHISGCCGFIMIRNQPHEA
jgi:hypothetical protein